METPPLDLLLNGLAVAAGAALLVERFIELLQSLRERANNTLLHEASQQVEQQQLGLGLNQVEQLSSELKRDQSSTLDALDTVFPAVSAVGEPKSSEFERHDAIPCIPLPTLSAQQARLTAFLKLAPVAAGIVLAAYFELQLLALFQGKPVLPVATLIAQGDAGAFLYRMFDIFLSGVLIGGGSQPVHVLIKFITRRRLTSAEQERQEATGRSEECQLPATASATAIPAAHPYQWQSITYLGGVKPASLENTHKRLADADQIVVHHTAMHSQLGFDAIVDEFLVTKQWLTGYHAVIMPNGDIKPFCRWDRTGNHARGHNHHTLGIALHGNFHQSGHDDHDRYANDDGQFGNVRPTAEQLHSAARLIALWTFLYPDMKDDFLVPHRQLNSGATVCPGSRFPWETLTGEVAAFRRHWSQQSEALAHIEAFSRRQYVYAGERPGLFSRSETGEERQTVEEAS